MTAGDGRPVRPFFLPPTLLVRQAASALLAGRLTWLAPMISPTPGTRQSVAATVLPSSFKRI